MKKAERAGAVQLGDGCSGEIFINVINSWEKSIKKRHKLKHMKFHLNTRKHFFNLRVVKHLQSKRRKSLSCRVSLCEDS